jgi:hypothetical protein
MITYGNNANPIGSLLFYERLRYAELGYPINNSQNIPASSNMDFWFLKPYYGRVDYRSDVCFTARFEQNTINESIYLKTFPNSRLSAINFVVDAYNALQDFYNNSCLTLASLNKTGPLSLLRPIKSWYSPVDMYKQYFSTIASDFLSTLSSKDIEEIISAKDYIRKLSKYFSSKVDETPISFSGYYLSKHGSVLMTGMAVEIATEDYGDDFIKTAKYVENRNFKFFLEVAQSYGFYVDRDAPWRLVANLYNKDMLRRINQYNLKTVEEMFDTQYTKNYSVDVLLLKEGIYELYNNFATIFSRQNILVNNGCVFERKTIIRNQLTFEQFEKEVPEIFFVKLYCFLRAKEIKFPFTQSALNNISIKALEIYKLNGLEPALKFINYNFNSLKNLTLDQKFLTAKNPESIVFEQQDRKTTPKLIFIP